MDELVEDDDVALADKGGDRAESSGITGGKGEGGFSGFEFSEGRLQFVMGRQRAADKARSAGASTKVSHRAARGFRERGMRGKPQVIIGRKIQERPTVDDKLRTLWRIDPTQDAVQATSAQFTEFKSEVVLERVHLGSASGHSMYTRV